LGKDFWPVFELERRKNLMGKGGEKKLEFGESLLLPQSGEKDSIAMGDAERGRSH